MSGQSQIPATMLASKQKLVSEDVVINGLYSDFDLMLFKQIPYIIPMSSAGGRHPPESWHVTV